jgi:transposase
VNYYVGLDVSLEQTAVCIIDDAGHVVVERSLASHPDDTGECLAGLIGTIGRVGLEAGRSRHGFMVGSSNVGFASTASRCAR